MKTCRFGLVLLAFVMFAAFVPVQQANAVAIVLDPGPLGDLPSWFDIPFSELNGTKLSGQSQTVDIMFADQKWIYVWSHLRGEEDHGALLILQTDYNPGTFHYDTLPGTAYLLDMSGDPLSGPMNLYTGGASNGSDFFAHFYTGASMAQSNPLEIPFCYYGIHYDFTLPDLEGFEVTGAALRIVWADRVSVPEPSTLFLLGSGLAGLVAYRKRKRIM